MTIECYTMPISCGYKHKLRTIWREIFLQNSDAIISEISEMQMQDLSLAVTFEWVILSCDIKSYGKVHIKGYHDVVFSRKPWEPD